MISPKPSDPSGSLDPSKPPSPAQRFEDLRKATIAVLSGSRRDGTRFLPYLPRDIAEYIISFIELSEFRFRLFSVLKNESEGYERTSKPYGYIDDFYKIRPAVKVLKETPFSEVAEASKGPEVPELRDLKIPQLPVPGSHISVWSVSYVTNSAYILITVFNCGFLALWKAWFNEPIVILPNEGEFGHRKDAYNKIYHTGNWTDYTFIIAEPHEFNRLFMNPN